MLLESTGSAQKLQVWEDTGRKVAAILWRANGKEDSDLLFNTNIIFRYTNQYCCARVTHLQSAFHCDV